MCCYGFVLGYVVSLVCWVCSVRMILCRLSALAVRRSDSWEYEFLVSTGSDTLWRQPVL